MTLKVLTANRLLDGVSVWFNEAGEWQPMLAGAKVASEGAEIAALEAAASEALAANLVVDANLIDVELRDGVLHPIRLRERVRADGPTIEFLPAEYADNNHTA